MHLCPSYRPNTSISSSKQQQHVIGLSLSRRLDNLLPVAQRTNASTSSVDEKTWRFGPRVRLSTPSIISNKPFPRSSWTSPCRTWKILSLGPQKLAPRVGDTSTRVSGLDLNIPPFQGRRVLSGLVRIGLTIYQCSPTGLHLNKYVMFLRAAPPGMPVKKLRVGSPRRF